MVFSLQTAHTFIFHSHFSFVDWFQSFLTRIQIIAYINLCQVGYFWVPKTTEHRKRRSSRSNGSTFPIHHLHTQSRTTIVWLVGTAQWTGDRIKREKHIFWRMVSPFPMDFKTASYGEPWTPCRRKWWSVEQTSRGGANGMRCKKPTLALSNGEKIQWFVILYQGIPMVYYHFPHLWDIAQEKTHTASKNQIPSQLYSTKCLNTADQELTTLQRLQSRPPPVMFVGS